jgi:hypothetical protein
VVNFSQISFQGDSYFFLISKLQNSLHVTADALEEVSKVDYLRVNCLAWENSQKILALSKGNYLHLYNLENKKTLTEKHPNTITGNVLLIF